MKRLLFISIISVLAASPAMAALSVNYNYVDNTNHALSSIYTYLPGFTVDTYDLSGTGTPDAGTGWTYTAGPGGYQIVQNDVPNEASAPYDGYATAGGTGKDTSYYLSVPDGGVPTSGTYGTMYYVTVDFGVDNLTYLGLHWGSEDNFNEIAFYKDGNPIETITGSQVNGNGNGAQDATLANRYVNIFTSFTFDSIQIRSYEYNTPQTIDPYAFELDNLSVAAPLPGAVLLGILGLGAAGIKMRKYA